MMMTFWFLHLKRQSDALRFGFQQQLCCEFVRFGRRNAALVSFGVLAGLQRQFLLGLAAINNNGGLHAFYRF